MRPIYLVLLLYCLADSMKFASDSFTSAQGYLKMGPLDFKQHFISGWEVWEMFVHVDHFWLKSVQVLFSPTSSHNQKITCTVHTKVQLWILL